MKYPPLPDPEAPAPGPAPEPAGTRREPPAPTATPGTSAGPAPGDSAGPKPTRSDGEAGAETPIYAARPSSDHDDERIEDDEAGDDEATDDEFAELIERVDLDDLEDLDDEEAEDDAVEVPTLTDEPDAAPGPASVQAGTQLPGDAAGIAARHRIGGDEPIPMLTEVVQVPRYDSEDLPQSLAEVDWGDLAQRVRENVLERLLRRSDALLDAQLQDTLVPVLERAAETVAHELHDALNRMIRDIVARAVTEELTRLHAEIAKRNRSRPR